MITAGTKGNLDLVTVIGTYVTLADAGATVITPASHTIVMTKRTTTMINSNEYTDDLGNGKGGNEGNTALVLNGV